MKQDFQLTVKLPCGSIGYVVVDSILNDTSSGGVRISSDLELDEIGLLAREMTLKFCFAGLGRGGGKSGIKIPDTISFNEKLTVCEEFGRRLGPIIRKGVYYPGMDMNCGPQELGAIYRGAGLALGSVTDTSFFTAVSVAASLEACRMLLKLDRPLTVAIEGFGSVAAHLAVRLSEDSYKIIAISTIEGAVADGNGFNHQALAEARKLHGDLFVRNIPGDGLRQQELLAADVDILIPAARVQSITAGNANLIKARAIVPVANAPFSTEAVDMLNDRGILCLPGFVTNSGGVFASGLSDNGVAIDCIERLVVAFYRPAVYELLELSICQGRSPVRVAENVAIGRQTFLRGSAATPGSVEHVARKLARFGMYPRQLKRYFAKRRFKQSMLELHEMIRGTRAEIFQEQ